MTRQRRYFVAYQMLRHILDNDQDLALAIYQKAEEIAMKQNPSIAVGAKVSKDEVETVLDPWVRHALRDQAG